MQAFPSKRSLLKHAVQAALLGACLGGGVLPLAVMADSASADTQVRAWAIAPGSLTSALDQFARQAGISLSYDATSVAGKTSTGLSGNFDREQALGQLLRGQGLQAQRQGKDIWLLLPQMADTGCPSLGLAPMTITTSVCSTDLKVCVPAEVPKVWPSP